MMNYNFSIGERSNIKPDRQKAKVCKRRGRREVEGKESPERKTVWRGEGEGNADFCCGFLLPSPSLLHEVFLFDLQEVSVNKKVTLEIKS